MYRERWPVWLRLVGALVVLAAVASAATVFPPRGQPQRPPTPSRRQSQKRTADESGPLSSSGKSVGSAAGPSEGSVRSASGNKSVGSAAGPLSPSERSVRSASGNKSVGSAAGPLSPSGKSVRSASGKSTVSSASLGLPPSKKHKIHSTDYIMIRVNSNFDDKQYEIYPIFDEKGAAIAHQSEDGTSSVVSFGYDKKNDRDVVIKRIYAEFFSDRKDPKTSFNEAVARAYTEKKVAELLADVPLIPKLYEFSKHKRAAHASGDEQHDLVLVFELVGGLNALDMLRAGKGLDLPLSVETVARALKFVDEMRKKGYIAKGLRLSHVVFDGKLLSSFVDHGNAAPLKPDNGGMTYFAPETGSPENWAEKPYDDKVGSFEAGMLLWMFVTKSTASPFVYGTRRTAKAERVEKTLRNMKKGIAPVIDRLLETELDESVRKNLTNKLVVDALKALLTYDPKKRPAAMKALELPLFKHFNAGPGSAVLSSVGDPRKFTKETDRIHRASPNFTVLQTWREGAAKRYLPVPNSKTGTYESQSQSNSVASLPPQSAPRARTSSRSGSTIRRSNSSMKKEKPSRRFDDNGDSDSGSATPTGSVVGRPVDRTRHQIEEPSNFGVEVQIGDTEASTIYEASKRPPNSYGGSRRLPYLHNANDSEAESLGEFRMGAGQSHASQGSRFKTRTQNTSQNFSSARNPTSSIPQFSSRHADSESGSASASEGTKPKRRSSRAPGDSSTASKPFRKASQTKVSGGATAPASSMNQSEGQPEELSDSYNSQHSTNRHQRSYREPGSSGPPTLGASDNWNGESSAQSEALSQRSIKNGKPSRSVSTSTVRPSTNQLQSQNRSQNQGSVRNQMSGNVSTHNSRHGGTDDEYDDNEDENDNDLGSGEDDVYSTPNIVPPDQLSARYDQPDNESESNEESQSGMSHHSQTSRMSHRSGKSSTSKIGKSSHNASGVMSPQRKASKRGGSLSFGQGSLPNLDPETEGSSTRSRDNFNPTSSKQNRSENPMSPKQNPTSPKQNPMSPKQRPQSPPTDPRSPQSQAFLPRNPEDDESEQSEPENSTPKQSFNRGPVGSNAGESLNKLPRIVTVVPDDNGRARIGSLPGGFARPGEDEPLAGLFNRSGNVGATPYGPGRPGGSTNVFKGPPGGPGSRPQQGAYDDSSERPPSDDDQDEDGNPSASESSSDGSLQCNWDYNTRNDSDFSDGSMAPSAGPPPGPPRYAPMIVDDGSQGPDEDEYLDKEYDNEAGSQSQRTDGVSERSTRSKKTGGRSQTGSQSRRTDGYGTEGGEIDGGSRYDSESSASRHSSIIDPVDSRAGRMNFNGSQKTLSGAGGVSMMGSMSFMPVSEVGGPSDLDPQASHSGFRPITEISTQPTSDQPKRPVPTKTKKKPNRIRED